MPGDPRPFALPMSGYSGRQVSLYDLDPVTSPRSRLRTLDRLEEVPSWDTGHPGLHFPTGYSDPFIPLCRRFGGHRVRIDWSTIDGVRRTGGAPQVQD